VTTLEPGRKLGSYRITRLLGEGGMGTVYEVEHAQLGVRYALKAFAPQTEKGDVMRKKFLAEGKVLARLRHPHLVRVFDLDIDSESGAPYFVMDLVTRSDGEPRTLDKLDAGELDEEKLLVWFEDLCRALDYVHSQGIVHRDIKRGNVLLRDDGHAVLSDFGVSRIFGDRLTREIHPPRTIVAEGADETRLVMGTGVYMAPEVLKGREATPAADAYSLGVMFFHLLTGIWYAPETKVLDLLDGFNYRWHEVLPRLLAVDPSLRPVPLLPLVAALRPATGPAPAASPNPSRPRRLLWAAALVVLLAAAGAAWVWVRTPSPAPTTLAGDDLREVFSASGLIAPNGVNR